MTGVRGPSLTVGARGSGLARGRTAATCSAPASDVVLSGAGEETSSMDPHSTAWSPHSTARAVMCGGWDGRRARCRGGNRSSCAEGCRRTGGAPRVRCQCPRARRWNGGLTPPPGPGGRIASAGTDPRLWVRGTYHLARGRGWEGVAEGQGCGGVAGVRGPSLTVGARPSLWWWRAGITGYGSPMRSSIHGTIMSMRRSRGSGSLAPSSPTG